MLTHLAQLLGLQPRLQLLRPRGAPASPYFAESAWMKGSKSRTSTDPAATAIPTQRTERKLISPTVQRKSAELNTVKFRKGEKNLEEMMNEVWGLPRPIYSVRMYIMLWIVMGMVWWGRVIEEQGRRFLYAPKAFGK